MQTSELPDLAHTDTKPLHWLATATAMAAVIAAAGALQPDPVASASASTPHRTATRHGTPAATAPDPARATFPLDCAGLDSTVAKQATGDLDGDARPETVAVVHCAAGSGTPPSGVYVLTNGTGTTPRVVATLVDPAQKMSIGDFGVRDGIISATLLGYSSTEVPRCCPDQREEVTWQWRGGAFVRATVPAPAGA